MSTWQAGKEKTKVPEVLGYEDSQATTLLEEAGLKVTHGYAYDDNVEKDHVISSDPVAGTEVEEGSTVKIIISNGKETKKIAVPNLKGTSVNTFLPGTGPGLQRRPGLFGGIFCEVQRFLQKRAGFFAVFEYNIEDIVQI